MTKFRTNCTLLDIIPPTRVRRVSEEENICAVAASVAEDRDLSIRRRVVRNNKGCVIALLGFKAYKIQLVQELQPGDLA